tara:strand:- start:3850 stop:4614 length:765 start_codon:yes stop_codon:yes gene_type:complete
MEQSNFLKVALKAVKEAETIILKYYKKEMDIQIKEDTSPVTQADTEAEKCIKKIIKEHFPDHGFIGEESGKESSTSEYTWIIDPIDGTKNFTRNIPLFATLLALMKNNEIILGVSNLPALNELLYAEKGKGAYYNEKKLKVSTKKHLNEAYLTFGSLRYMDNHINELMELVKNTHAHRGIGDAYCYHHLAQGNVDIMVEASVEIWDIAPYKIIVEEAQGKVTNLQGKPITVDSKNILTTNGFLHDKALEILNKK